MALIGAMAFCALPQPAAAQNGPQNQQGHQFSQPQADLGQADEIDHVTEGLRLVHYGDVIGAAKIFEQGALVGKSAAMMNLAQLLETGAAGQVKRDLKLALYWYHEAAKRGNGFAAWRIGSLIESGQAPGYSNDIAEAARYYKIAIANNGPAAAKGRLGMIAITGEGGMPQDMATGQQMVAEAANEGHPESLYNYGLMLIRGDGGLQPNPRMGLMMMEAARLTAPPEDRSRIGDAIKAVIGDIPFEAKMHYQNAARDWLTRK